MFNFDAKVVQIFQITKYFNKKNDADYSASSFLLYTSIF